MLSALKNFGVTFLISALLFGVIAYFATLFVSNTVNSILDDEKNELDEIISAEGGPNEETTPAEVPDAPPAEDLPEGKSFNLLLVTTDYRPDLYNNYRPSAETVAERTKDMTDAIPAIGLLSAQFRDINATSIVLVRADREKQQYVYTYFTPEMQVYTPAGFRTLSEIYRYYGTASLAEYVNAMTGLKIHYTAVIDGCHFDDLTGILGNVTVTLPRDVYSDGKEYTMNYDTPVERIGDDGYPWTEHVPNQWIFGAGESELDAEKLYILSTVTEHTEADRDAKQKYVLDIVRAYIAKLVEAGDEEAATLFGLLSTERENWKNVEGYEPPETEASAETPDAGEEPEGGEEKNPEEEPPAEEQPVEIDPDLPFDPTPVGDVSTWKPAEGENEKETEADTTPLWISPLKEPAGAILETDCNTENFRESYPMLTAVTRFDSVNITYPCTYTPASADSGETYHVRLKDGLDLFLPYRTAAAVNP